MIKCPHCNGFLPSEGGGTGSPGQAPKNGLQLRKRLLEWVDTPVALSDLLLDSGFTGDLTSYEPLDHPVLRTAFRATDALRGLNISAPPQWIAPYCNDLWHDWSPPTLRRYWGIKGRWWVRKGFEDAPGYIFWEGVLPPDDLI